MDTTPETSTLPRQASEASGATDNSSAKSHMRGAVVCAFPYSHQILVRELEGMERALVDERRMRREQDIRYTTLIMDIAVWALSRLETDYQFRVNNGKSSIPLIESLALEPFFL